MIFFFFFLEWPQPLLTLGLQNWLGYVFTSLIRLLHRRPALLNDAWIKKERKKERKAHEIQNEEKEGKKQSSIISFDIFQFGIFSPTQRQGKGEITIIIIVMASDRPTDQPFSYPCRPPPTRLDLCTQLDGTVIFKDTSSSGLQERDPPPFFSFQRTFSFLFFLHLCGGVLLLLLFFSPCSVCFVLSPQAKKRD